MSPAAPALRIRGRAAEMAVLGEALDRVASGRASVVLIEGEAGIGKTRLLDEVLLDAGRRGMQVVTGRAGELERSRPLGLVASAFRCVKSSPDPRRAGIAELLSTAGGQREPITVTSDPGLQFRAVDAFADLAEELALAGPLVIGLDDLQWADPSSLLTLGALCRRLEYLPVMVLGCMRPAPRVAELDRLIGALEAAGARQLLVQGLDEQAVTDLVAEAVAAAPGPQLLTEISGAAGNPLFVIELLGALMEEGAITTSGGRADVTVIGLPPTLRLTVLRRLSFLSDDTQQTLRGASILGSSFALTDLSAVLDRSALTLSDELAEALQARVIEDDGTQLRFRHDLIRDAIYEDLPLSIRQALHREAGQRLARSGAAALQVAEHLGRAATPGDAEAIEWLRKAAREAAATSPDVAADLLRRATTLISPTDPRRDQLLAEQASSLVTAGRIDEALATCRELLGRHHDPEVDGRVRVCLGHALLAHGQAPDALRELEQAVNSSALSDAERTAALGWAGFARISLGDLDGAAADEETARARAIASGDHLIVSIAMATLAAISECRGHVSDALGIIDEAIRMADASPHQEGHRYPIHITRGHILIELDRLEEARSTLGTGMRLSERLGVRWPSASYSAYRAFEAFIAGEWDDASTEIDASLELAEGTGETYSSLHAYSLLTLISLHRNDVARATEAAEAAASILAETGARFRAQWAQWALALVREAHGDISGAFVTLSGCWDRCAELGLTVEYRMLGPDLVRLALARGDRHRAREVASAVSRLARDNPDVPSVTGAALRCRGLAEDDPEILQMAVATYAQGSRPLELGCACEEAGAAFARAGDVGQAEPLLVQAVNIYERLGAARDIARVEALLREAGIRRGRRGRRGRQDRPQAGWVSLTPTERTVARFVAEGLSNPQIGDRLYISRRTVQTHLAHVFTKLDISSRAQLAAEISQHRGSQSPADTGVLSV